MGTWPGSVGNCSRKLHRGCRHANEVKRGGQKTLLALRAPARPVITGVAPAQPGAAGVPAPAPAPAPPAAKKPEKK
jgi:hypothetical protein